MGYLPRQLVDATLPHRDPGDVAAFEKTNGRYRLAIQAGPGIGFPYGSFPRLLLIHLATEAVRTRSRRVTLGPSLLAFLRSLGLPTTGGKRGTIPRFRDQTIRLLSSRIVSFYAYGTDTKGGKSMRSVQVATRYSLWWDDDARTDIEHASWVELSDELYQACVSAAVPLDLRIVRAIKQSALALDLYTWLTYRLGRPNDNPREDEPLVVVSWAQLHDQMGANYKHKGAFGRDARRALQIVRAAWPELRVETPRGRLRVYPTAPSVAARPARAQEGA